MENYSRNRGKKAESNNSEEFQEEEVWGAAAADDINNQRKATLTTTKATSSMILRKSCSGKSMRVIQSSAPMVIPDWSKIYRKSFNSMKDDDDDDGDDHDDGDDDDGVVPPHEYIARRLARNQIASFSMCEGVGRTLKGRDLSKLRNAILTKTGFLEG